MRLNVSAKDSLSCDGSLGTGVAVKAAGAGGSHMKIVRFYGFGNSKAHVSSEA
jgi:hypothetical protein